MLAGKRPDNLGIRNGKLTPCPNTPNCVCSHSDGIHSIASLPYNSSPTEAMAALKQVIQGMPRTAIITEDPNYLYAEFTIPIAGFVDDVEFYVDEAAKVIHVRSASRLGKSDLGVNRRRIETIRKKWQELKI